MRRAGMVANEGETHAPPIEETATLGGYGCRMRRALAEIDDAVG